MILSINMLVLYGKSKIKNLWERKILQSPKRKGLALLNPYKTSIIPQLQISPNSWADQHPNPVGQQYDKLTIATG